MDKEVRSDAKLKNLDKDSLDELWRMRYPVDDDPKLSYAEIQLELPRFGHTASVSTLSAFYSWLRQKRDYEDSIERAEQAKLQFAQANPDATPERLRAIGQMVFTNKSIQKDDLKGFVAMATLQERREQRLFEERKFEHAKQSDIEKAMGAIYQELKSSPEAEAAFTNLKDLLIKS